ncbi:MAG TPA: hypothetical protein VG963_10270 [Polyangiaceae bacterium]|nr:hypothetical protein [Polyangiaceae bacterium]
MSARRGWRRARRWLAWRALVVSVLAGCASGGSGVRSSAPPELAAHQQVKVRRVEVATSPEERAALAQIPALRSDRVEVALAVPEHFDAAHAYPILLTQVTADAYRPNIAELGEYAPIALARGYVVLTAQGIPWPRGTGGDTLLHRFVTASAGLRWLTGEIPQSAAWPIVIAGFSGGAKISQVLAVSLLLERRPVAGVFLGGCNEDNSPVLLAQYPAVRERFSHIAFFLSAGNEDNIAPLSAVRAVAEGLQRSGVERLRLSEHPGGHRLSPRDLDKGLGWLREQFVP